MSVFCESCLDDLDVCASTCGHLFHIRCLNRRLFNREGCPNCQTALRVSNGESLAEDEIPALKNKIRELEAENYDIKHRFTITKTQLDRLLNDVHVDNIFAERRMMEAFITSLKNRVAELTDKNEKLKFDINLNGVSFNKYIQVMTQEKTQLEEEIKALEDKWKAEVAEIKHCNQIQLKELDDKNKELQAEVKDAQSKVQSLTRALETKEEAQDLIKSFEPLLREDECLEEDSKNLPKLSNVTVNSNSKKLVQDLNVGFDADDESSDKFSEDSLLELPQMLQWNRGARKNAPTYAAIVSNNK